MKSIIATTVSVLLFCTGTAMAQQAMHEGHKKQLDTNDDGKVSQQEYQAFMTSAFKKLDADNDRFLSQTETADVLNASQFAAADANKDGRVSQSEFTNRVMQDFTSADKSGDGHLN